MTSERKYFSGSSLENALLQAARHHGLQPEEVAYRKIEKRHGFLRSRKSVVIEVDPAAARLDNGEASQTAEETPMPIAEEPESDQMPTAASGEMSSTMATDKFWPDDEEAKEELEAETREPTVPAAAPDVESTDELIEAARRGLDEIMRLATLDLEVEVTEGDGQLEIELSGADRDRLIEDRGNLLLSIQHLLPRLIRGFAGRSIPCHVDSEDFHATREVELRKLAEEAAQEVLDRQKSRTLPPMNPAERRIIHVALADKTEVATESQGRGFFKRVTISPAIRRPRGFDRY
jgi:spoIIIJ-associated protein